MNKKIALEDFKDTQDILQQKTEQNESGEKMKTWKPGQGITNSIGNKDDIANVRNKVQ